MLTSFPAYSNNEINSEKITKPVRVFQLSLGGGTTHSKIDDLSICPPIIILDLFCLLVIPHTCILSLAHCLSLSFWFSLL